MDIDSIITISQMVSLQGLLFCSYISTDNATIRIHLCENKRNEGTKERVGIIH